MLVVGATSPNNLQATTNSFFMFLRSKTAEITGVPISSDASASTTRYGCKNPILSLVSWFLALRCSR
jgi:hypothetical protein